MYPLFHLGAVASVSLKDIYGNYNTHLEEQEHHLS
jgi:hypothetical protein